jgi:mannose-6-phosphate isomerase-like protein (cupin superfamily)
MPTLIRRPAIVRAAGNRPKKIEEFIGRVNSGHAGVSIARMTSPAGWIEPGQRPAFDEFTLVLRGRLRVESDDGALEVRAGEALWAPAGEWIRYSTPGRGGAQYISVCVPAFSAAAARRDRTRARRKEREDGR